MKQNQFHGSNSDLTSEKPLQSWKEIAAYLEIGERTARRWEKGAGLPVRRHGDGKRSGVYAYPSEIAAWRIAHEPKCNQTHLRRWRVPVAVGTLSVVLGGWFIFYGPVFNPPNPLVEAAGITIRQVWAGPGSDWNGSPSPDGRYLSFVDWETGDLALRNLATEENRRLTDKGTWAESNDFALHSIFSPDSQLIVYNWFKGEHVELRMIGVDGSAPRVLYDEGAAYIDTVDWLPDGKQILVGTVQEDGTAQIAFLSIADGTFHVLKTIDRFFPFHISLSPDGRYIVYDVPLRGDPNGGDIFLLSTDTNHQVPLVQHPAYDLYPVWTPDGKGVIFASDRTGTMGLWGIQVADGRPEGLPRLVKADIGRFSPMGFTQNGSLYYAVQTGMIDIYRTSLDLKIDNLPEASTLFSHRFVGFNYCPDWSSDGKYLSYLSKRSPLSNLQVGSVIVIRSLATGDEREVVPELSNFILPYWSPNGKSFVTVGQDWQGNRGVFRIDAENGDTALIVAADSDKRLGSPAIWSRDGKSIFYIRRYTNEKRQTIEIRNLETGQVKESLSVPSPEDLGSLGLSRSGRRLAFVRKNRETGVQAIYVVPVAGGKSRKLLQVQKPEELFRMSALEWTPDDKEILFIKRTAGENENKTFEMMRISSEGGEPRRIGMVQNQRIYDLRLDPDGNTLVFTMGQPQEFEVWAMEGFLPTDEASD
jgi:Tol biopolymer transport system component